MTTVRVLERLTPAQERDRARLIALMGRRLSELEVAFSDHTRKEAGEWILRVAAEIYAWSR
jgi:hypothetical protein